jgi:alpha-mannosidase
VGPIVAAREVNAQEQPVGSADIGKGGLKTSFTAYQPRTFALRLNSAPTKLSSIKSQPYPKLVGTRERSHG